MTEAEVHQRIDKVNAIIRHQDDKYLTQKLHEYRLSYLYTLECALNSILYNNPRQTFINETR